MSELKQLYAEIARCQKCEIARLRTHTVPGEGAENAEIFFIGEAPGFHEDQQGRPFVGASGHFLDQLLASIDLNREKVYIANVIKCRPPGNRDPLPEEISNCRPYLDKQIALIAPKMIVTLGRFSMAMFFPGKTISKIHGTSQTENGVVHFAMYHPAAALHQVALRKELEADIKKIPVILEQLKIAANQPLPQQGIPHDVKESGQALKPLLKQLNMFEV
jgi:uracil-DNA glycosylase family 4